MPCPAPFRPKHGGGVLLENRTGGKTPTVAFHLGVFRTLGACARMRNIGTGGGRLSINRLAPAHLGGLNAAQTSSTVGTSLAKDCNDKELR